MASLSRFSRPIVFVLTAIVVGFSATPARALLNFDGTRNQLFVFGGVTFGYSSNLFAESEGRGDYNVTSQVGAELKRKAGVIGVDATAKVDFVNYGKFTDQNTINPSFALELTKTEGKTTGSLTVQAYRETRSDSAVNLRTSSWNFPVNLNLRYPVSEKFYATSGTGFVRRTYDNQNQGLVNYTDFSEQVDVYHRYTSKLDLLAGYRVRFSRTSDQERATDHWFNVGATGGLFSKLTGTVRFGYQLRDLSGPVTNDQFDHFNASATVDWPFTRKLLLSLQGNRDFNTIATGASVDSESVALRAQFALTRKVEFTSGVSVGKNKFLNRDLSQRHDTFFSADVGARYRLNEHFQFGVSYTYLRNWSSVSFSDYENHGFSFDITARF